MKHPKTLTVTQVHSLLDSLLVHQGTAAQFRKGVRNHLMGVLMLETGIRVSELCQLIVSDILYCENPVENLIIRSEIAKGKKERQIPISTKLCMAISEMNAKVWSVSVSSNYGFLFYSISPSIPLTTRTVERVIKRAGRDGPGIAVNPHMLRHTFATRICRKASTAIVQELLGHAALSSTQVYLHPNSDDLTKAINGGAE